MEEKLITLAIHTEQKALILKDVLEKANIQVRLESINKEYPDNFSGGTKIKIKKIDLPLALAIVESRKLFSYADSETYKIDDGRSRILVPVDFSEYSLNACYVAFNIAKLLDAKVKIFHVYYAPYYPSSLPIAGAFDYKSEGGKPIPSALDKARESMENICVTIDNKVAKGEFPPVNYSYSIREGMAGEEITNYSKEYKPILIVLGTRGSGKNADFPLGSVTADVIETTSVPVLAIPSNSNLKGLDSTKNISFLTNFTQKDYLSFDHLVNLLQPHQGVKIILTHIINQKVKTDHTTSQNNITQMVKYFSDKYKNLDIDYKLIDSVDIVTGIEDFLKKENMNIVALNTRKRNMFSRIFIPSMSRKLMSNTDITLLVLRG